MFLKKTEDERRLLTLYRYNGLKLFHLNGSETLRLILIMKINNNFGSANVVISSANCVKTQCLYVRGFQCNFAFIELVGP